MRLLAFLVVLLASVPAFAAPNFVHGTYYHPKFNGRAMACGGTYSDDAYTVATNDHPCGAIVEVSYGGRTVTAEVTDRCSRCGIDLSRTAAKDLGILRKGRVKVQVLRVE